MNSRADAAVLLEVEGGDLDRRELVDPERVLAPRLLVVLEAHVDLRPDAAHEEALVVADVVLGDVHELVAEVGDLGPVVGVDEAHLHLVDEGVPPAVLHLALRLHRLVGADVVVGERVVDDLQPHLDRHLVRRRAVLAEQELEHEDRHVRADLDLPDEVLAHDLAGEEAVHLVVERISARDCSVAHGLHSKPNRDVVWASGTAPRRSPGPARRREARPRSRR